MGPEKYGSRPCPGNSGVGSRVIGTVPLDAAYDHALMEPEVRVLVAGGGRTTQEWLHDLHRRVEGLETRAIVRTSDSDDNKHRVYLADPTTDAYRLRVTGVDVSSDVEGCGTDSMLIYHAWMYEDQDRDTNTDRDDQIRPEE